MDDLDVVKRFFSKKEWEKTCEYEKRRYVMMYENHNAMLKLGLLTRPFELTFRPPQGKKKKKNTDRKSDSGSDSEMSDETWTPELEAQKEKDKYPPWCTSGEKIKTKKVPATKRKEKPKKLDKDSIIRPGVKKCPMSTNPVKLSVAAATAALVRYPKRSVEKKNYTEPIPEIDEDDILYCHMCDEAHVGQCSIHGKMKLIEDTEVAPGDILRAEKSLPRGLCITRSKMRGAGRGILAHDVFFKKGSVFGPYEGEIVSESDAACNNGYCWQIMHKGKVLHFVNGKDIGKSNWMRFVNCSENKESENLTAFQYKGGIYYRALKMISPGDELVVWYGDEYGWELAKDGDAEDQSKPPEQFSCSICQELFSCRDYLQRHQKWHRDTTGSKRFACSQCNYSTEISTNYQRHLLVHSGDKPFQCSTCNKQFGQAGHLKRHSLIHSEQRPFECNQCSQSFNQMSHLRVHLLTHGSTKPFTCAKCGRGFIRRDYLTRHLLTHNDEKKFKCNFCDYGENQKSNIKNHEILKHTGEFPHSCNVCGKGFVSQSQMRQHLASRHQENAVTSLEE